MEYQTETDEPATIGTVRKTFKYKLLPTKEQEQKMAFVLRRCRELYNTALQERRDAWQKCQKSISCAHQSAELPGIKEVRPEYHDVHSQVLQDVLTRLDRAFQAFFRRVQAGEQPGYPRFQRGNRYHSFTYKQFGNGAVLDNGDLVLVKIGRIAVKWSRPMQGVAAVRGLEAGLHAFVECDAQVPIEPLVQRCLRQGILLMDLSRYYVAEPTQRGVVLGYGGLEQQEIAWVGTQIVAQALAHTEKGHRLPGTPSSLDGVSRGSGRPG